MYCHGVSKRHKPPRAKMSFRQGSGMTPDTAQGPYIRDLRRAARELEAQGLSLPDWVLLLSDLRVEHARELFRLTTGLRTLRLGETGEPGPSLAVWPVEQTLAVRMMRALDPALGTAVARRVCPPHEVDCIGLFKDHIACFRIEVEGDTLPTSGETLLLSRNAQGQLLVVNPSAYPMWMHRPN